MTSQFRAAVHQLAHLPDARLSEPWEWRGRVGDVRDALYVSLQEEQVALAHARPPHTEAERILILAERARGDLSGLLVGLDDTLLDADPGDGEWPLREVLAHILRTERLYVAHVRYALARADSDPVRKEVDVQLSDSDRDGGIDAFLERLEVSDGRRFADIDASALERPTVWAGFDVDVRFRLHRFAAHIVEHTVQCEKVLSALGHQPTEAARIVRRLVVMRAAHDARSAPDLLNSLDAQYAQRAADVAL